MRWKWTAAAIVVATGALVLAAPALAQDTQELDVQAWQNGLGKAAETEILLGSPTTVAATAKATVYAPKGYAANLTQTPGTELGAAIEDVTEAGTHHPLSGKVLADDPAKYAADPAAQACAPGTHAAAWTLSLGTGTDVQVVHVFVDPAAGTDANFASYVLQACFASPDVPTDQGGAAAGAKLYYLDLDLPAVFANPAAAGIYTWRALLTPYIAGTSTPSPGGTVEVHSIVALPQTLTLQARYDAKHGRVTLSGRLLAAGQGRAGINVHLYSGLDAKATLKAYATVKTKADGTFTLTKPVKKTTYFGAHVNFYAGSCEGAPIGSASCVLQTIAPPPNAFAKVVVKTK